jgi:hypothetical protein
MAVTPRMIIILAAVGSLAATIPATVEGEEVDAKLEVA